MMVNDGSGAFGAGFSALNAGFMSLETGFLVRGFSNGVSSAGFMVIVYRVEFPLPPPTFAEMYPSSRSRFKATWTALSPKPVRWQSLAMDG